MKKTIFYILAIVLITSIFAPFMTFAQSDEELNLEKYWRYRQRFRDHFIVKSEIIEEEGVNWPAMEYITYEHNWPGGPYYEKIVDYSDGNANIYSYLTVLSTELWLLKNNNIDYSETLKELYYFMLAIERLDCYSESHWRKRITGSGGVMYPDDFNGFHMRDDVSDDFWEAHGDDPTFQNVSDQYNYVNGIKSIYSDDGIARMEGSSHDNLTRNISGLAILHELVGEEDVSAFSPYFMHLFIPNYLKSKGIMSEDENTIHFDLWAEDLVERYIHQLQCPTLKIIPPYTGVCTHWVLQNPVWAEGDNYIDIYGTNCGMGCSGDLVAEGNGMPEGGIYYTTGWGFLKAAEFITGKSEELLLEDNVNAPNQATYLYLASTRLDDAILTWQIEAIAAALDSDDDASTSTYAQLIDIRENNKRWEGLNSYDAPFEALPLLYIILHDHDKYVTHDGVFSQVYADDYNYYLDLLNIAPFCFPGSNYVWEYSTTSRLVWPPNLSPALDEYRESSGLDYMALHNLFYVVFGKKDFEYLHLNETYDFESGFNVTLSRGGISAENRIFSGANVLYEGTNPDLSQVLLQPGFQAKYGCEFKATASEGFGLQYMEVIPDPLSCEQSDYSPSKGREVIENDSIIFEEDLSLKDQSITFGEATCNIFPNPVNDIAKLQIENVLAEELGASGITIDVFDVTGKNVKHLQTFDTQVDLDMSGFNPGMYSVRVYSDAFQFNKQIVKK